MNFRSSWRVNGPARSRGHRSTVTVKAALIQQSAEEKTPDRAAGRSALGEQKKTQCLSDHGFVVSYTLGAPP